jgi:hypothetical protein
MFDPVEEEKKAPAVTGDITNYTACAPYVEKTGLENTLTRKRCLPSNKTCKRIKLNTVRSVHAKSCLTPDALQLLVNAWNAEFPNETIAKNPNNAKVWEELKAKITKHVPLNQGESAWLGPGRHGDRRRLPRGWLDRGHGHGGFF